MKNPTALMQEILQSKTAQEIIDYVSQVYGESYVGLWLFEVIGQALDQAATVSEQLLQETTPATTKILLDYWENEYGIAHDYSLTDAQRRQRINAKIQSRRAITPVVLAQAASAALGGASVEIVENIDKNTFKVNIRDAVTDIKPAEAAINRMKPAHLTYKLQLAVLTEAPEDIKLAMAITHGNAYDITVDTSINPVGVYQVADALIVLFGVTAQQSGSILAIS